LAYIGYGGSEAGYAVKTNGTLWVWGHEDGGNLGFSDSTNRSSPTQLGSQTDWATINTKSTSLIATKTGGQLYAWGTNTTGQLGISNSISKSSPVQVGSLTNWQVGMAEDSSVCIKTDGTLWTWGSNDEGQLGHNLSPSERATASSPVQVGSLTTWENAVVSTGNFMFGVESGELYAWGRNSEGQLGLSSAGGTNRSSPTQVGSSTDWISAATGLYVGLAIGPES
jgi:trimeric autotransporter adhesin